MAITALDATEADAGRAGTNATLAYGGPSGLVRLHAFSLPRELEQSSEDRRNAAAQNEAESLVHFAREATKDATVAL